MMQIKTVTDYIHNLTKWQPEILLMREIVLSTGLQETIKWGSPCYTFGKDNVVGLAAFKSYTGIWFFQGGLLQDKDKRLINAQEGKTKAMLQWRFHSLEEIANAPIRDYILESIENFRQGKKIKNEAQSKTLIVPEELLQVLDHDQNIADKWAMLSAACQREYAQYINEAKRSETKMSRLEKIKPMIMSAKGMYDKYKK